MLDAGLNFGEKLRTRGLAAVLRRVVEVSPDQYCPADERRSAWQGHLQQTWHKSYFGLMAAQGQRQIGLVGELWRRSPADCQRAR